MKTSLPVSHYNIGGRRQYVIYLSSLASHLNGDTTCRVTIRAALKGLLDASKLRGGQDFAYNAKRDDWALGISAAQAILIMATSKSDEMFSQDQCWQAFHQITDFITGGK